MALDIAQIRSQFPSLNRPEVFLDNPGGTQIVRSSIDRMTRYYIQCNANHGGAFLTSQISDALVEESRQAMADFLNAASSNEIIFGANMTSLTFSISRALGKTFKPGETIVLTRLDHDANVSPWLMMAEDRGLNVRFVDFHPEDGTLNLEEMQAALADKPRLVAVGYASNALGTINPIKKIVEWAHQAGTLTYIDAVQYAPHGQIDVQDLECDFLVCSAYKFFGPHLGILYGRYDLLEQLPAYKVRPAPAHAPGKFETGTGNFEHMAGVLGTMEYFENLGKAFGDEYRASLSKKYADRKLSLKLGMQVLHAHELALSQALLTSLKAIPGCAIYGIKDETRLSERVPTYGFTLAHVTPKDASSRLGEKGIFLWDGNFYALEVTRRLGLEEKGGVIRVGAAHYNTLEEIQRFANALVEIN
jgi:cysteine desulfurase family protein (TIGR01976 family)